MSEPGFVAAMRGTLDGTSPGKWWVEAAINDDGCDVLRPGLMGAPWPVANLRDSDRESEADAQHIAAWCPDNAARLLALADRMADALADFADERHQQRAGSHICDWCGNRWPCDHEQAADALRAWREATGSADTSADSPAR